MRQLVLIAALLAALPLGAQTATPAPNEYTTGARDSVIRATAMRGFADGSYIAGWAVRGDTADVKVVSMMPTPDGFTDATTYSMRLFRTNNGVWLRTAPRIVSVATLGPPKPRPKKPPQKP